MVKKFKKGGGRLKKKTAIKKHDPESRVKLCPYGGKIMNKAPSKNDSALVSNVFKMSPFVEVAQSNKKRRKNKNKSENTTPANISTSSNTVLKDNSTTTGSNELSNTISREEAIRNSLPKWKQIPQLDFAAREAKIKLKEERRIESKKGQQRDGETRKQYNARIAEEKEKKLADARRKISGKQRKLKTKEHNLKRLAKLRKKGRGHSDDVPMDDNSKPVFGDVVERPPIFEESVKLKMDSLAKKSRGSGQMTGLENYITDVQASYKILKQKRQEKEQR